MTTTIAPTRQAQNPLTAGQNFAALFTGLLQSLLHDFGRIAINQGANQCAGIQRIADANLTIRGLQAAKELITDILMHDQAP